MKAENNRFGARPHKKVPSFPFAQYPLMVFGAIAALQFALLLPILDKGPLGQHAWRQAVGHAMARNYVDEPSGFFWPRNDIRPYATDQGFIYHEFPLQYYGAAKLSQTFGASTDFFLRLLQYLVVSLAGIIGYFFAIGLGYTARRSMLFGFFMTSAPVCFYYMGTVVPNFVGLVCFMAGTAFLLHWSKLFSNSQFGKRSVFTFSAGIALVLLGTLIKPLYLLFGLPLGFVFLNGAVKVRKKVLSGMSMKEWLGAFLVGGACIVLVNTFILHHAKQLYAQAPFLQQMHTPMGPADSPTSWPMLWKNLEVALGTWFVEMYVGHAALMLFAVGIYCSIKSITTKGLRAWLASERNIFWACWALSFVVYSCFFVTRFADHDYYICSLLPVAALLSSSGADFLLEKSTVQKSSITLKHLVIGLCVAQLSMMYTRVYKRWYVNPQVPIELRTRGESILLGIDPKERVVVVGDSTPIVFLYYLHRKGFAIGPQDDADQPLQEARKHGIPVAVVYKGTALDVVQKYYPVLLRTEGEFQVFKLPD